MIAITNNPSSMYPIVKSALSCPEYLVIFSYSSYVHLLDSLSVIHLRHDLIHDEQKDDIDDRVKQAYRG